MIRGNVRNDEARIRLKVRGPGGKQREIAAVIDTGYTGSLSLPPAILEIDFRDISTKTLRASGGKTISPRIGLTDVLKALRALCSSDMECRTF